ncbi:MAG TPA: SRPBCC family protein [Thermoanaerobaculia bacterium]|nr:SRPBCC family protein [Thermoanaerobaculia bacterium]
MKDVVTVSIDAPVATVAELFANPENGAKWMEDTTYEPISGEPGMPGSQYRLVSRYGKLTFTTTVVARDLPREVRLFLDSPTVSVSIRAGFVAIAPARTQLTSDELFRFKGVFNGLFGIFARRSIRNAHRRQMESFKRFVEQTRT